MSKQVPQAELGFWRSRIGIGLAVFLAVAGFLLWEEHQAHIMGYMPLILILGVCVGMHFYMHGAHDDHHQDGDQSDDGRR